LTTVSRSDTIQVTEHSDYSAHGLEPERALFFPAHLYDPQPGLAYLRAAAGQREAVGGGDVQKPAQAARGQCRREDGGTLLAPPHARVHMSVR
jgi:hypothetical protein